MSENTSEIKYALSNLETAIRHLYLAVRPTGSDEDIEAYLRLARNSINRIETASDSGDGR